MGDDLQHSLLLHLNPNNTIVHSGDDLEAKINLIGTQKTWEEFKKVWRIAGPSIFCRVAMFSLTIITQSLAGHLSDLDLAAFSIATTLLISISFGFLVLLSLFSVVYVHGYCLYFDNFLLLHVLVFVGFTRRNLWYFDICFLGFNWLFDWNSVLYWFLIVMVPT